MTEAEYKQLIKNAIKELELDNRLTDKTWDAFVMNNLNKTFDPKGDSKMISSNNQVDGDHYTKLKIQPMYYSMYNNLNALQHTIVKYVSRYNLKGKPMLDLQKAKDCIDKLIEWEMKQGEL